MKKRITISAIIALILLINTGIKAQIQGHIMIVKGVGFALQETKLEIEFYSDKIVRVIYSPTFTTEAKNSIIVLNKEYPYVNYDVKEKGNKFIIKTSQLNINIDKSTGAVSFYDKKGNLLLTEKPNGRELKPVTIQEEKTYNLKQTFKLNKDEAIYGLGQYQDGVMNWRGHKVTLIQKNMNVAIPFLVSTNKYGILWDNYSHTEFESTNNEMSLWSEVGETIDYYFIYGDNTDEIISGMRYLTGKVPMLPKWAYGYWQSKERYKSRSEVLSIAAEYRRRQLPIDVIVQDWQYWGKYGWSSMLWDETTYPDPKTMLDSLHNVYNIKMMISVWPHIQMGCPLTDELGSKGHLLYNKSWKDARLYDAYSEEGRNIYWKHLSKGLFAAGVDGWWMDATEPELKWENTQLESKEDITGLARNAIGTFSRYLNTYPLFTCTGAYENQRKETNNKRVMILTRSAFAGQQRTGAITWSGDIGSSYKVLKNQIAGGLNFSLSGNPYWNTDIGGFFPSGNNGEYPKGVEDSAYRELYVRWFQFGTFCPIMRSHGTGTPREIWQFGDKGGRFYDALVKYDNLRYRLLPYIYSTAWCINSRGYTIMRALPMDFASDKNTYSINDEFMFGKALLVKPVTNDIYYPKKNNVDQNPNKSLDRLDHDYFSVTVYMPACEGWYDFWTGNKVASGKTIERDVPLDIIPLYVRAGSIIPIGPELQYTNEKSTDTLEIRIYAGANAEFDLYEDEGDGYNYEKGAYSIIPFKWNEKKKTLTIGDRSGEFNGMLRDRNFHIVIVNQNKGVGIETTLKPDATCKYTGKAIELKLADQ